MHKYYHGHELNTGTCLEGKYQQNANSVEYFVPWRKFLRLNFLPSINLQFWRKKVIIISNLIEWYSDLCNIISLILDNKLCCVIFFLISKENRQSKIFQSFCWSSNYSYQLCLSGMFHQAFITLTRLFGKSLLLIFDVMWSILVNWPVQLEIDNHNSDVIWWL